MVLCSFVTRQLWFLPRAAPSPHIYRVVRQHCCCVCQHSPHIERPRLKQVDLLNTHQAGQVDAYIDCLLDWNQRMNLTAVTERSSIMERHIADSLALLPVLESTLATYQHGRQSHSIKVVDVGTGAGLPGIVLAIARPAWHITLLESLQKRCNFLQHVIEMLSLNNVRLSVLELRLGAIPLQHVSGFSSQQSNRRRKRSFCLIILVARAVAEMRVLAELCLPLVRLKGLMVAAKGANPEEEMRAAERAALACWVRRYCPFRKIRFFWKTECCHSYFVGLTHDLFVLLYDLGASDFDESSRAVDSDTLLQGETDSQEVSSEAWQPL